MSSFKTGDAPYYNGFDPSKQYSSVLYRPGFIVQTQELNEMQSLLKQNIRNISGVLLTDGDIVEGCQCVITDSEEGSVAKNCKISSGRIYLDGDIHNVQETNLVLKGTGTETVGVILVEEVVTEREDPSLLDNSAGFENASSSGAHRQKTSVRVLLDSPEASTLYTVVDGALVAVATTEDTTLITRFNNTLARRTFDESGNYRVSGLQLSEKGQSNDNQIFLNISAGKAYIKGNELTKPSAVSLALNRSKDLRFVETEVQEYTSTETKFMLNNAPVITDGLVLKAYVQATTNITKGVTAGSDPFPSEFTRNSVATIIRVWDSTHGDYEIGSNGDCYKSGNSVKWTGNGSEPSAGSTYSVTFSYIKTMVYGTDYDLYAETDKYFVRFLTVAGSTKPISGTNLLIDYNYMLYRRDVIVMDDLGNINAIAGQSDNLITVASPVISDEGLMVLGSVLLTPLSDKLSIINNTNKRLSMNEIQGLAQRLSNVEESLAVSDLDKEAMDGEDATNLVGIYTDGFLGLTKSDVDHSLYNCSIDLDNKEVTLSAQETLHPLNVVTRTDVSPISSNSKYTSLITAPATEAKLVGIETATGVKVINQYAVFSGSPVITITPRQNNWIDTNSITVQGATVTKTVSLRRWWYHGNESWVESEKAQYIALGFADGGKSAGWDTIQKSTQYSATSILNESIKYMQQITIKVEGKMLGAYTDNIIVNFNGAKINVTPTATGYQGTQTGTLKSNVSGYCSGTFQVPANTLCGTVEVQLYPAASPNKIASTTFTSNGTLRTTTRTIWTEVTKVTPYDPLAQTFQFDKDQFITSVGLYFCVNDGVSDVSIQIRGVTNGYPNQVCYSEKVLSPSNINISEFGTAETKVQFDDPVFCEANTQYCIVVLTESNTNSMFFAELGGKDVKTQAQLIKNPYIAGMMFSSSNAITWTAHQGSNLKFNIYGNIYNTPGYVYFNELNNVSYDRIMILADVSTPNNTEATWEYSKDGGFNWYPIVLFNDMELDTLIGRVLLRVKLVPTATVSPVVLAESCYFIGFSNNQECNYVSKNIVTDSPFHHIKQIVSIYDPGNTFTGVSVYYATDRDGITWKSGSQTHSKSLGSNWYRYTFEDDITGNIVNFRARIYMTTNNSTVRPRVKNLMNILT